MIFLLLFIKPQDFNTQALKESDKEQVKRNPFQLNLGSFFLKKLILIGITNPSSLVHCGCDR